MAINLGTIFAQIGLDTSLLRAGVKKANVQLKQAEKGIGGFIRKNQKAMLGFGAASVAAVGAIGIASIKMAGDFDQAMRNVNTITKLTEEQFNDLKEEVIDLSKEVPLTTAQLSEGLFNVASAGVQATDQMNFLTASSKAAVAGQADLAITVKGLTGVIKGFGDEFSNVDKVADLFFKTNELGVTTFEELASSMGKVVPIASSLGVTQEELFASMATLTGVTGNTSEVVTQLKAAFTNLVKPTKDAENIARELGISFDATSIQTLGLAGFLEQVQEATGGNVATMGKLFGSVEGLGAILALTGSSSEKFAQNLDAMGDSAGAATDAFSEQQKGLNNQLQILKNNVSAIALDIGGKIIPALTDFTTKINELDDDAKDNIATTAEWSLAIVGSAGAVSLLLVGISKLIAFVGTAAGAMSAAIAAPLAFTIAMDKLSDTVGNKWVSAVLDGLSPVQSMIEQFSLLKEANRLVEDGTLSWIGVLTSSRVELQALVDTTDEAVIKTNDFTGSLEAEKVAMQRSAEGLRVRTQSQLDANTATDDGIVKTDGLGNSMDELGGDAGRATVLINGVRVAIESLPSSKTVEVKTLFVTGGISVGQALRTPFERGGEVRGFETGGTIRGYANGGGTSERTVLVGERGPELARLPMGTRISANNNLGQAMRDNQEGQEIVVPVTVLLNDDVIFESVERSGNREEFRRIS